MKTTNLFYLFIIVNILGILPAMGNSGKPDEDEGLIFTEEMLDKVIPLITESEALLLKAIDKQNINELKRLLKKGINLNYLEPYIDMSPLMVSISVRNPNPAIVKALIDAKANPNKQNNTGLTALMIAVKVDAPLKIVTMLLDNGANPHVKDRDKKTAIDYAEHNKNRSKNSEKIDLLLKSYQKQRYVGN